jgi:hypothetical protein
VSPFIQGVPAGYGIAIPVGGIAVLIVDAALRRGFQRGFFAPRAQVFVSAFGYVLVIGLGARMLLRS